MSGHIGEQVSRIEGIILTTIEPAFASAFIVHLTGVSETHTIDSHGNTLWRGKAVHPNYPDAGDPVDISFYKQS